MPSTCGSVSDNRAGATWLCSSHVSTGRRGRAKARPPCPPMVHIGEIGVAAAASPRLPVPTCCRTAAQSR